MSSPSHSARPVVDVRDATGADIAVIRDIYAHHVLGASATFELEPPSGAEMFRRFEQLRAEGLPYLAGLLDGSVVGFAYCAPYRPRAAYRFTVEDSVYLLPAAQRRGLGIQLLAELIGRCERAGYHQMVAVIGGSANHASVAVHRKLGFAAVGTLREVGFKHGRWVDTVILQRALAAPGARSERDL